MFGFTTECISYFFYQIELNEMKLYVIPLELGRKQKLSQFILIFFYLIETFFCEYKRCTELGNSINSLEEDVFWFIFVCLYSPMPFDPV